MKDKLIPGQYVEFNFNKNFYINEAHNKGLIPYPKASGEILSVNDDGSFHIKSYVGKININPKDITSVSNISNQSKNHLEYIKFSDKLNSSFSVLPPDQQPKIEKNQWFLEDNPSKKKPEKNYFIQNLDNSLTKTSKSYEEKVVKFSTSKPGGNQIDFSL